MCIRDSSSISLAKMEQLNSEVSSFFTKPVVQIALIALVMVLPFYFVFTICYNYSRRKKARNEHEEKQSITPASTIGKTFEEIESLYHAGRRKK